jgi:hypothetical protein
MSIEAAFPMIVRWTPLGVWVRHDESSGEVLYVRPDEAHRYQPPAPEAQALREALTELTEAAASAVIPSPDGAQRRLVRAWEAARAALASSPPAVADAKDAARYRWLRDYMWAQGMSHVYAVPITWGLDDPGAAGKNMDAAIDAAMGKQP